MEFNPFSKRYAAIQRDERSIQGEKEELSQQLSWHTSFNPDAEVSALRNSEREVARTRSARDVLWSKQNEEAVRENRLSKDAKLGLDPRHWFSSERRTNAKEYAETRDRLTQMNKSICELDAHAAVLLDSCRQRQSEIERHRKLDSLELKGKLYALEVRLENMRPELASLLVEKQRVDVHLSAPLQEHRHLSNRKSGLESDVRRAENFERQLSNASNNYDKAMVHEQCGKAFNGESRPARVVQQKRQEIQSVQRNLEKVESRLMRIGELESRTIATLVIDGNNLCYEGREFVGLAPLHALTYALVADYRVIVIFDASIRKLLMMDDDQVAFGFPREARVHVVASKQAADETVLVTATPSDAYVISNDRFRDFTDKSAVREQRLIRHEIVAGKVLIHDLHLAVTFNDERHS